jgi:hypothetical protein
MDVLACTYRFLMSLDRSRFAKLLDDPAMRGRVYRYLSTDMDDLSRRVLIGDGIYVGTHLDANSTVQRVRQFLREFEIPLTDITVYLRPQSVARSSTFVCRPILECRRSVRPLTLPRAVSRRTEASN